MNSATYECLNPTPILKKWILYRCDFTDTSEVKVQLFGPETACSVLKTVSQLSSTVQVWLVSRRAEFVQWKLIIHSDTDSKTDPMFQTEPLVNMPHKKKSLKLYIVVYTAAMIPPLTCITSYPVFSFPFCRQVYLAFLQSFSISCLHISLLISLCFLK